MFIFGGKDSEGKKLSDMWVYDFGYKSWTEVKYSNPEDMPLGRSGHCSSIIGKFMLIYGGLYDITKELNDMHLFNLEDYRWIKIYEDTTSKNSPIKIARM